MWVTLNGEIYNFPALRDQLVRDGHELVTHSDTEVIVHLYEEHGLDFVDHLTGMFAIALWDAPARRLVLARDRVGIKPLYYRVDGTGLAYASELAALVPNPVDVDRLDADAIDRGWGLVQRGVWLWLLVICLGAYINA